MRTSYRTGSPASPTSNSSVHRTACGDRDGWQIPSLPLRRKARDRSRSRLGRAGELDQAVGRLLLITVAEVGLEDAALRPHQLREVCDSYMGCRMKLRRRSLPQRTTRESSPTSACAVAPVLGLGKWRSTIQSSYAFGLCVPVKWNGADVGRPVAFGPTHRSK